MPPVVIGGALAAAGGIASAAIGSSAAGKAADASSQAAAQAEAEQRAAREQAYNTLSPYIQAGLPATQQINALLGLGGTAGTPATPAHPDYAAYVQSDPNLIADAAKHREFGGDLNAYGQWHWNRYGQYEGRNLPMTGGTDAAPGVSVADAAAAASKAFDTFRNSTGYDWRLSQGMNALNSGYAGAGTLQSGAAIKGAIDYGQGMASQEFGNYLNALGNQQSIGLRAGSAAAGVGGDVANSLGNIYMTNGANQAGAAMNRASSLSNGVAGLANFAGSILAPNYNSAGMNALVANNTSYLDGMYGNGGALSRVYGMN